VAHLSAGWEVGYNRLLLRSEGVLYEDPQIQIGLRSEYRGELGCIIIYFTNRSSSAVHSFTTTLDNRSSERLKTDIRGLPETTIQPEGQTQQTIMFEAKNVFTDPPTIRVSYLAGALQALTLQLPVLLHKYMDSAALSAEEFFKRWKQIGGAPREAQRVFGVTNKGRTISRQFVRRVADGFGWGCLDGVDPNSKNLVGATVLYTSDGGKFGCLLRLGPNYETNVRFLLRPSPLAVFMLTYYSRCSGSRSEQTMRQCRLFWQTPWRNGCLRGRRRVRSPDQCIKRRKGGI
jgi:AP-2 complex subunit alpha